MEALVFLATLIVLVQFMTICVLLRQLNREREERQTLYEKTLQRIPIRLPEGQAASAWMPLPRPQDLFGPAATVDDVEGTSER